MLYAMCHTLLIALLIACNFVWHAHAAVQKGDEGRFVLYFNGPEKTPEKITLELAAVDAVREDGTQVAVFTKPVRIDALDVVGRQLLLAETFLPRGRYEALRLRIPKAQVRREGKEIDLAVPKEGFSIAVEFEIRPREATPLFMTWDVERAIEREVFLRPAFAFEGRARELSEVMAYVSNEGSDTVSVIDRQTDRVVDVIQVGKGPKGMTISPDRISPRVLVVNSHFPTLTVIDSNDNRVFRTANLEVAGRPSDVAISPDGRTVYVVNTALNTVSALESVSFVNLATIPVGKEPVALALGPEGFRLFVVNQTSNTVSVIDARRNVVTATISVEFQPAWVAVVATEAFVAHLRSPRLSIISLSSLQVSRTVDIGVAAAVLPGLSSGRIFAALVRQNRVSLFDVNLNAQLDSAAVGADPHRLAVDITRGKLYVVNRGSDSVTVLNRDTLRVLATIPVGKRPYTIAIVQ